MSSHDVNITSASAVSDITYKMQSFTTPFVSLELSRTDPTQLSDFDVSEH